jgi:hypothetical protein
MKVEIQRLKKLLANPTPRVPFGEKAQKWDYRVFCLACELLCVRLTASQGFRVTEIFLRFFFPGLKVRVPSQEMFKKWRSMMYNIVKYVNVKCCEKMDVGHVGADESRKGGVSILGVIMRVVNGTRTQDLMLDCAVIGDQCAETELAAMLSSFRQEIGEWVVEVDIMRVVSGISDNASGAVKVSTLFGAFKKERYDSLSAEEKAALTEEEALLWQTWDTLRCEMHKMALACQHFIGGGPELSTEEKEELASQNPDKAQMVHGRVEHAVQKRLSAFSTLARFWQHVEGHVAMFGEGSWPDDAGLEWNKADLPGSLVVAECVTRAVDGVGTFPVNYLSKLRYGFDAIKAFVPPHAKARRRLIGGDLFSISNGIYALSKLFSGRGDHSKYFLNESNILQAYLKEIDLKHKDRIPAFKGSRMYWLLEAAVPVLINHEDYLRYLHDLRGCTSKPNKLIVCAFEVLSDQINMAAVANRALCYEKVVHLGIFVHKHLGGRW